MPGVVATEELAGKQLHHDVVGLLVPFPFVTISCVPNRASDVGEPVEALQTFKGLAGSFDPGDDFLQLVVEEAVVRLRIEGVPSGFEEVLKPEPVPESLHTVYMVAVGGSAGRHAQVEARQLGKASLPQPRTAVSRFRDVECGFEANENGCQTEKTRSGAGRGGAPW